MPLASIFNGSQADIKAAEAHTETWQYAPGGNPGLLQTRSYANGIADRLPHLASGRDTDFETRMDRGTQMRTRDHLEHRFILGASVHDHAPGTPLMDEQRAHWAALHHHHHIQIRVLSVDLTLTSPNGFTLRGGQAWFECGDLYVVISDRASLLREWERLWDQAVPLDSYQGR